MLFQIHNRAGLTLIEVLIVAAIFVIGLGAMLSSAVGLFTNTSFSGDFLVASHLAAEGVEVVRNRRDENAAATPPRNWNDGFDTVIAQAVVKPDLSSGAFAGRFIIDPVLYTLDDCMQSNQNCQVYIDPVTGVYGDAGMSAIIPTAAPTKFFRLISFTSVLCTASLVTDGLCATGEVIGTVVTSTVRWRQGPSTRTVEVATTLFNWIITP